MGKHAALDSDGRVVNIVAWDGESDWLTEDGYKVIEFGDNNLEIGGAYINSKYFPPLQPELTQEQHASLAISKKARLMSEANSMISILQDAVNFGIAIDAEISLLEKWKNIGCCLIE